MAAVAACSDTGGSARVPAALCGLTGFRPTAGRISRDGMIPVSRTLDTVGILGPSVECCGPLDAVLNGGFGGEPSAARLKGIVFGVPTTVVLDDLDRHVARAFECALRTLAAAGAAIVERPLPTLGEVDYLGISGNLVAAEAYWWHKPLIGDHASLYDPAVLSLIRAGEEISGLDYIMLHRQRTRGARRLDRALRHYDYLLMPTVPVIAPPIQSLAGDRIRSELMSALLLRNPAIVSFLDWCALSIPCHRSGEPPVGLTVAARGGRDVSLLGIGKSIEECLAGGLPRHRLRTATR
jgi:aspartyl-tRNA(Asn)/glutamyl-tRNA(Gln) amidotransferase subunit A